LIILGYWTKRNKVLQKPCFQHITEVL